MFLVTRGLQFASSLENFQPLYLQPFFLSSLLPLLLPGFRTDAPEVAPRLTDVLRILFLGFILDI